MAQQSLTFKKFLTEGGSLRDSIRKKLKLHYSRKHLSFMVKMWCRWYDPNNRLSNSVKYLRKEGSITDLIAFLTDDEYNVIPLLSDDGLIHFFKKYSPKVIEKETK